MQKWKIVSILLMLCAVNSVSAQNESFQQRALKYIEQYKQLAIAEQHRSGVPAAIKLAQGIHETNAGASELAVNANNHFGIKCKKEWQGDKYAYTDDAPNECFRKYPDPVNSWKDHSDYLKTNKRYAALFDLAEMDYKGWAHGLKRAGYATNPKYASLLIKLVEEYHLQDYTIAALEPVAEEDTRYASTVNKVPSSPRGEVVPGKDAPVPAMAVASPPPVPAAISTPAKTSNTEKKQAAATDTRKSGGIGVSYGSSAPAIAANTAARNIPSRMKENPETPVYNEIVRVNDLKAFYAQKGTVLLSHAIQHNIRYARLLELNDLADAPLEADMYIYLEKKHTTGNSETYTVEEDESLIQIAQKEGIQLKYLKAYNKLGANEEPMPGSVLYLLDYAPSKPATRARSTAPKPVKPVTIAAAPRPPVTPKPEAAPVEQVKKIVRDIVEPLKSLATGSGLPSEEKDVPETPQPVEVPALQAEAEPVLADVKNDGPEAASAPETNVEPIKLAAESEGAGTESLVTEQATVSRPSLLPTATLVAGTPATLPEDVRKPPPVPEELPASDEIAYAPLAPVVEEATPEPVSKPVIEDPIAADTTATIASEASVAEFNIANEPAVEEKMAAAPIDAPAAEEKKSAGPSETVSEALPATPVGPQDEFTRLKAKLDKVVYASPAAEPAKEKPTAPEAASRLEQEITAEATDNLKKLYTVKKGDTAFGIAKKHKITMKQLMDWNDLDFKAIKPGQQLKVKP